MMSNFFVYIINFKLEGITNSKQRLLQFKGTTVDFGLQDILEEYTGIQEPVEWKIYSIFEGLDPRKRQAFALVRLMTSVYNWK